MPRLSTLSNPTGLVDLEKQRISILLDESGKRMAFSLARLDLTNLSLPLSLRVIAIARRGNAEERVELGSAASWDKGFRTLTELGEDGTWVFRILLVEPDSARLVAAAENVRPEGQGDSSSFIALEPADLGECPWEIQILELEGQAVIRFSKAIYFSAGEASADKFFMGLILPEAVRRLAAWIAGSPNSLEDAAWDPFKAWLVLHGISDEVDLSNADLQEEWCHEVVHAFCDRFQFASELKLLRAKGTEE